MKVKIIGFRELQDRIATYSVIFPKTYTNLKDIKQSLLDDFKMRGGTRALFGIQVAPDWEDKCYGFQYVGNDKEVVYKFIGIWKC